MSPRFSIAHYRVTSKLGQGGMGEVWRATDTRLNRDVAIKILPEAFAHNADRMARFTREAQVLAALNHPNVAAIYGVEERALIMELVEGPTLAERMQRGRVPMKEAVAIACQIADGLDAAHERGIVHRDLKPANIKFTQDGAPKILDFGLAKVRGMSGEDDGETATLSLTEAGMILGTAGYMAPEQAQGKTPDKRADIWAFGVVVYEMLAGERLFRGGSLADTLAVVLTQEPDLERVPPQARRLLRRCLEKDPRQRLRDIGEARFLLQEIPPASPASAAKRVMPWVAATLAAALAAVMGAYWSGRRVPDRIPAPLTRLRVDLGPEVARRSLLEPRVSPDGQRLLFLTEAQDGKPVLAVRNLDGSPMRVLAGTEGAAFPFFSPDGEWIGFAAGGKLKKVSVQGGAVLTIGDGSPVFGASWGDDQNIVLATNAASPLMRVSANGGKLEPLTRVGIMGDATHRWPQVLPGARAVLFTSHKIVTGFDDATIEAVVVRTGERKTILRGAYYGRYADAGGHKGYLVYVREGALLGVPFDAETLAAQGRPVPLLEDLAADSDTGAGQFDFANTGTLLYRSGKGPASKWPILWLDGSGKTESLVHEPGAYYTPRLSPDGKRLAISVDRGDRGREIEVYDWPRGTMTRLTFTGGVNVFPVWSPDGKYIVFESLRPNGYGIGLVRADGSGTLQHLAENNGLMIPTSFSPDGRWLTYHQLIPATGYVSSVAPFDVSDPEHPKLGAPRPLQETGQLLWNAAISPNGRWLAYATSESGTMQLYVTPFPGPGGRWQLSMGGGSTAIWASDGQALYFKGADGRIMVSRCSEQGASIVLGKPEVWSNTRVGTSVFGREFTMAPDGKRFAIIPPREAPVESGTVHVTFVPNFFDEMTRKMR